MRSLAATILMCGLSVMACSKNEDPAVAAATPTKATVPAAPAVAAVPVAAPVAPVAPAGNVEASPDMKAFMAMLDGADGANKALKKYGNKTTQTDDLGMYTLGSPKLIGSEKVGALQCYTMETAAGVMKHTSRLCWDAKGKIAEITDKSE